MPHNPKESPNIESAQEANDQDNEEEKQSDEASPLGETDPSIKNH